MKKIKIKKNIKKLKIKIIMRYYQDDKELSFKIFKLKFAYISNDIDEKNTTNKEENQVIIKDIEKNKDKLYEQDDFHNFVIRPSDRRIDLIHASELILEFNEVIQLNGD